MKPIISKIANDLKETLPSTQSKESLSELFLEPLSVAFRGPKSIRNHLIRGDILPITKEATCTKPCGTGCPKKPISDVSKNWQREGWPHSSSTRLQVYLVFSKFKHQSVITHYSFTEFLKKVRFQTFSRYWDHHKKFFRQFYGSSYDLIMQFWRLMMGKQEQIWKTIYLFSYTSPP